MRQGPGFMAGLCASCLAGMMSMLGGFADAPQNTNRASASTDQAAAAAFFIRIARESTNPYITAIARESAARLVNNHHPVTRYEIPIISQPDNSIAVPAILNGTTLGTFIVDTGSSYTVITPRMAAKLGISIQPGAQRLSIITANGVIQAPLVTLKNVMIGPVQVNEVQAIVQDLGNDLMLSGLLGMNVFKGKSLTIQQDHLILEDLNG